MSNVKCPRCKQSGMLVKSLFAACPSEDCDWFGMVSSLNDPTVSLETLSNGLSILAEKVLSDPVHCQAVLKTIEQYNLMASRSGMRIQTVESVLAEDTSGQDMYYPSKIGGLFKEADLKKLSLDGKVFVLRWISMLYANQDMMDEDGCWMSSVGCVRQPENSCVAEELGFPPLRLTIDKESGEIAMLFSTMPRIWHPLDWFNININKEWVTHYLAVLQIDGQNINYIVQECLESGEVFAAITEREFLKKGLSKVTRIEGSASDACERLHKHYSNAFNSLVENNDPIEVSWDKVFGYDYDMWAVVSEIFGASKLFEADATCRALHSAGKTLRGEFERLYNESRKVVT